MKDKRHIQSFNKHQENLNISDVSDSDYKELKTISQLIEYLQKIKEKEGDIFVCYSEEHEYWGSAESWITPGYNLTINTHAQPDGPKSGKSVKAMVFGK